MRSKPHNQVKEMDFQDWDLIDYEQATQRQLALLEQIAQGERPDTLVFCRHPQIVTLGRASQAQDTLNWKGAIAQTSRGGKATYHGPNQQVIYPLIDLKKTRKNIAARDLHSYLRQLELAIIEALKELNLPARSSPPFEILKTLPQDALLTGVWVGGFKVASIGIAVKKWVTYHGAALNIQKESSWLRRHQPLRL